MAEHYSKAEQITRMSRLLLASSNGKEREQIDPAAFDPPWRAIAMLYLSGTALDELREDVLTDDQLAKLESVQPDEPPVDGVGPSMRALAGQVAHVFGDEDIKGMRNKSQVIEGIIIAWLKEQERLLVDPGQDIAQGGRPYLVDDTGAVWPIQRDCLPIKGVIRHAGINPTERIYAWVVEAITLETVETAPRRQLRHWQYWTGEALYVSCGPTHLVRAKDGELERVRNGADGVWFASEACYPAWEPAPTHAHPLKMTSLSPPLEAPPEVPSYCPETQRGLLGIWIAALLSGLRPLPMLIALGDKGGGKTTAIRAILRLLLGEQANLTSISRDPRDLYTALCTAPLVGLDNVDDLQEPWLCDALAQGVTGGAYTRRKLHTDTQQISRPLVAAIAITTRTGAFLRPDLAERTLPLFTAEFANDDRRADSELGAEILVHRNALMTWGAQAAEAMLRNMSKAPEGLPLRFIDFAKLAWGYMRMDQRETEAAGMLLALRHAQAVSVGEADPLVQGILSHGPRILSGQPAVWTGGATHLVKALQDAGALLPHFGGGKTISRMLRESKHTLDLLGWRLSSRQSHNTTVYTLQRAVAATLFPEHPAPDYTGPATWQNADHDLPVTITGYHGPRDGREWFTVDESQSCIPRDELVV